MATKKVLIIDDEPDICELIEITLSRMGLATQSANNLTDAKIIIASEDFDLCLTDMRLPDGNGIDMVKYIQKKFAHIPVAVITAHGNMESAVNALKAGAFDFVSFSAIVFPSAIASALSRMFSSSRTLPGNG